MVTISSVEVLPVRVSQKTEWLFLQLRCSDGMTGIGEATMEGHESQVMAAIRKLASAVVGISAEVATLVPPLLRSAAGDRHAYAAVSALEQAAWDAEGKRRGEPVAKILGARRNSCRLYANINRGIEVRSPEGFAKAARSAVDAGYSAIKIAPFDRVDWTRGHDPDQQTAYADGIAGYSPREMKSGAIWTCW